MSKKTVILALVLCFFCISSNCDLSHARAKHSKAAARARHADRNRDGHIDRKEIRMEKAWEHKQAQVNNPWEEKVDKNDDGVVSPYENRKAREQYIENKSEVDKPWEEKADKNDDGVVDRHELHKAKQHM